ncbi:MAG: QueT transporter family protein [Eubacteriales bacterium]
MKQINKLLISAMVMAIYIALMILTQSFAFGQYQIRIATSLYSLSYLLPFLIVPLGLTNLLSNLLMGGLGPLDMFGGFAAGLTTAGLVYLIKKLKLNEWLIALPIIFIPGLMVPIWLSFILKIPYIVLAISICIGQVIPGIIGVLLIKQLKKIDYFNILK